MKVAKTNSHNEKTMTTNEVKSAIINHCRSLGLNPDANGYVPSTSDNLVDQFANWNEIELELGGGQGSELKADANGIMKFNAVHSSSALCVNNFAPIKFQKDKFSFLGNTDFTEASFEKKLSTGISTPNLDFYLKNSLTVIGIESKFIETLEDKCPNTNLDRYQNRPELAYLPTEFSEVLQHYVDCKDQMYLDVAQLLKHSIGLINRANTRYKFILNKFFSKPKLVYLYWQPTNWYNSDVYRQHEDEIADFKNRVKPIIDFAPMSYLELWKFYENDENFGAHIHNVKARYCIAV